MSATRRENSSDRCASPFVGGRIAQCGQPLHVMPGALAAVGQGVQGLGRAREENRAQFGLRCTMRGRSTLPQLPPGTDGGAVEKPPTEGCLPTDSVHRGFGNSGCSAEGVE
jgi:hypothetical protein